MTREREEKLATWLINHLAMLCENINWSILDGTGLNVSSFLYLLIWEYIRDKAKTRKPED